MVVLRDLVFLSLGTAGLIQQLFLAPAYSWALITLFIGMILGTGVLSAWFLAGKSSGPAPLPGPPAASPSPSPPGSQLGA